MSETLCLEDIVLEGVLTKSPDQVLLLSEDDEECVVHSTVFVHVLRNEVMFTIPCH